MPGRPSADEALDNRVAEHAVALLARKRDRRPLTAGFMQSVAASLGHRVGVKRASRMVKHLRDTGMASPCSRYKGKHGFWVVIYRLRSVTPSVRRKARVKVRPWWKHSLFGNPANKKPPGATEDTIKRWCSAAFRAMEFERDS